MSEPVSFSGHFFQDPATDRLMTAFLALAGEVWVLTERLGNLEALAAEKGMVTLDEIRRYAPPADSGREAERDAYVRRVLGALREP